ncbi:MAG: hypothetical protein OXE75_07865 [bacterium]|nr:hypothetical protein [bacterium]
MSLQLAATQLTAGNTDIRYARMGLYLMPYGPTGDAVVPNAAGTLEFLAEAAVVQQPDQGELFARAAQGATLQMSPDSVGSLGDPEVGRAAHAALGARIAIMNPPFTNRSNMGEKFAGSTQQSLRGRVDELESQLVAGDSDLEGFVDKNSIAPLFVALAERCLEPSSGVLVMIHPTIALTNASGLQERRVLAARFDLDTVLTCHQPGNINLSQNTNINESIVVMRRRAQAPPPPDSVPAKFVNLDRFPTDDAEVADLFDAIDSLGPTGAGVLSNGWGEASHWPNERIRSGDWTAAIWRSPVLAEAAARFAEHPALNPMKAAGLSPYATAQQLHGNYRRSSSHAPGAIPILKSKGADGQRSIRATPDEYWAPKSAGGDRVLDKASNLLVTWGQDTSTGRLTAVASYEQWVGFGWLPVSAVGVAEAFALAVYLNSTLGRLALMRNPGKKLNFPTYNPAVYDKLPIPDLKNPHILNTLAECWEATCDMVVPQYRDGECEVRRLWDAAVCDALGWDEAEMAALRKLLHAEPHVRGLGYGQYRD